MTLSFVFLWLFNLKIIQEQFKLAHATPIGCVQLNLAFLCLKKTYTSDWIKPESTDKSQASMGKPTPPCQWKLHLKASGFSNMCGGARGDFFLWSREKIFWDLAKCKNILCTGVGVKRKVSKIWQAGFWHRVFRQSDFNIISHKHLPKSQDNDERRPVAWVNRGLFNN